MDLYEVLDRLLGFLEILLWGFVGIVGIIVGTLVANEVVYSAALIISRIHQLMQLIFLGG